MKYEKIEPIWSGFKEFLPWLAAAATVLSANLTSNVIWETFDIWTEGKTGTISKLQIGYILFFSLMVWIFYYWKPIFFRPRTRYLTNRPPKPRKHLILFLSDIDTRNNKYTDGIPEGLILSDDLDEDITAMVAFKEANPPGWRWEMPLRSLRYHSERLETISFVCSRESVIQVHWLLNICKRYKQLEEVSYFLFDQNQHKLIPAPSEIADSKQGLNFESFDELSKAMWMLIRKYLKDNQPEKDIIIDFTGGQKVTSVVAAAVTFNRKIKAQYVQTKSPWDVLSYDVILASSHTGGFGL
jgi:hypothetical protein